MAPSESETERRAPTSPLKNKSKRVSPMSPVRPGPQMHIAKQLESIQATAQGTDFMSLPAELRNEIYYLALVNTDVIYVCHTWSYEHRQHTRTYPIGAIRWSQKDRPWREPSLLTVDRAIRAEASSIYYRSNAFEVYLFPSNVAAVAAWIRSIMLRSGTEPFKYFNFYIGEQTFNWKNFHLMQPLVELFAEVNPKLPPRPTLRVPTEPGTTKASLASVFIMSSPRRVTFQRALEGALQVGSTAQRENWDQKRLNDFFERLVNQWAVRMLKGRR